MRCKAYSVSPQTLYRICHAGLDGVVASDEQGYQ